jgi:hypothetical protein
MRKLRATRCRDNPNRAIRLLDEQQQLHEVGIGTMMVKAVHLLQQLWKNQQIIELL